MALIEGQYRSNVLSGFTTECLSSLPVDHVDILDAVRGAAAMAVFFMHCREITWIGMREFLLNNYSNFSLLSLLAYATLPFTFGAIGVPILFVVSGYVIHRRPAQQIAKGQLSFSALRFAQRRFIRIYPTFVAAILVTLVCDHLTSGMIAHDKLGDTGWWTLMSNILALQGILSKPFGSNGPLWSLAIEIQFYAIYPLALALRVRIDAKSMLLFALALSAAGMLTLIPRDIVAFPQYYLAWWLGAYLADREAKGCRQPEWWLPTSFVLIIAGCYLTTAGAGFAAFMIWALGITPVLGWLTRTRAPWTMFGTPLHRIGRFSYSLYVVHLPFIVLASVMLLQGGKSPSILVPFAIAALAGLAAFGFYLAAERPFVRLLARLPR